MVFPPSNPNLRSCGPVLALIKNRAPALSRSWRVCRNGRRCVYSVWAFCGCLSGVPTRRVSPSPLRSSAMTEDCSLQVRTGAGPPRRRRRPKRRCKGLSDMSMPMPKNVPRRAGAKIQIQREPTSCVRLIWRCFSDPKPRGGETRKPCLTPAHPSSRELNIYTK